MSKVLELYSLRRLVQNLNYADTKMVEMFGIILLNHCRKKRNPITTVKHGGGRLMVWGCFAAVGPSQLRIIEAIMISTVDQKTSI